MRRVDEKVTWKAESGHSVEVADVSVTPQSQALSVRCCLGGWVWNRPVAVLVERGEVGERVPIIDVTRLIQLGLYGLASVFGMVGLVLWIKERRDSRG